MEPLSTQDPSSFHSDFHCHDVDYDCLNYDQLVGLLHTESQHFVTSHHHNHRHYYSSCCPEWRRTMGQWCFRVVDHFSLDRELVSIAMQYLDRFAQQQLVVLADFDDNNSKGTGGSHGSNNKKICLEDGPTYQLVAMTCLYLALKLFLDTDDHHCHHGNDDDDDDNNDNDHDDDNHEEMDSDVYHRPSKHGRGATQPPKLDKALLLYETLTDLSRGRFTLRDVTGMEHIILDRLQWKVTPVTVLTFVHYYLSVWWWWRSTPTDSRRRLPKDDDDGSGIASASSSSVSMHRVVRHIVMELSRYLTEIAVFLTPDEDEPDYRDQNDNHDEKKECDETEACHTHGKKDTSVTRQRVAKETTTTRKGATSTANKTEESFTATPMRTANNGQLPSQIALAAILVSMDLITYEALPPTAREHFCNGVVQTAWPFWQQQMSTTLSPSSTILESIQYWQERFQEILWPELWLEEENYRNTMAQSSSSNYRSSSTSSSPIAMARDYGILNVSVLHRVPSASASSSSPSPPSPPSSPTCTFQSPLPPQSTVPPPPSSSFLGKHPSLHPISSHEAMNWGGSPVSVMHQPHHQFHPQHYQYDHLYHHHHPYPDQTLPHHEYQGEYPHDHGHHHHHHNDDDDNSRRR